MKLIDKDRVVAEIEGIYQETNYEPFTDEVFGKRNVCKTILDFINTIETKETDLMINTVIAECCDWLAICTDLSHDLIEDCRNLMLAVKEEQCGTEKGNEHER